MLPARTPEPSAGVRCESTRDTTHVDTARVRRLLSGVCVGSRVQPFPSSTVLSLEVCYMLCMHYCTPSTRAVRSRSGRAVEGARARGPGVEPPLAAQVVTRSSNTARQMHVGEWRGGIQKCQFTCTCSSRSLRSGSRWTADCPFGVTWTCACRPGRAAAGSARSARARARQRQPTIAYPRAPSPPWEPSSLRSVPRARNDGTQQRARFA